MEQFPEFRLVDKAVWCNCYTTDLRDGNQKKQAKAWPFGHNLLVLVVLL